MIGYSLWSEPWIPVVRKSGEPSVVSIRNALAEAHSLNEVYDPSPLVTVAIHRLLLAVLYRVFRVRNPKEWAVLWRAERFDADRLDGYGGVWSDRFDLLHPTHPFCQVSAIDDEKVHPISAIVFEAASGNNPTLFDHGRVKEADALPLDRAACHLLAQQLFAIGFGKSKPFYRMDAPLTRGLVVEAKGRNLFETLLLNLMPLDHWSSLVPDSGLDMPFWEMESVPAPLREGTVPLGPMHYLTWQSRQIHLRLDEVSGKVTGCQIRQRYCLPKDGMQIDPGKAYRKVEEAGWLPLKVDRQRAAWQFTHVLLHSGAVDKEPPVLIRWLAHAQEVGRTKGLDVPGVIGLTLSGLTTNSKHAAQIELWRREQLPLPAELLKQPDLVGYLEDLLVQAGRVERLLVRTALALVWAMGERQKLPAALSYLRTGNITDGKIPPGFVSLAQSLGMVTRFWPVLEAPFRQALTDLPIEEFEGVQARWQAAVQRSAAQAFQAARDGLLHAEAPFEVLTRIDHAFKTRLIYSFTERTKEAVSSHDDSDE